MASNATEGDDLGSAVNELTNSWQVSILIGIVTLILGLIVAFHPSTSLNVICVFIGITVLLGGIFRLVRSLNAAEQNRALTAVLGVLMIVVGLVLIRHLHLSRLLVALVVAVVFIVQGAVDLMAAFVSDSRNTRIWLIIGGVLSLAAGIVVLILPENSVTFLAVLVGIWFIVLGVVQVAAGLVLRHELNRSGAV